jgi:hypothetical protein
MVNRKGMAIEPGSKSLFWPEYAKIRHNINNHRPQTGQASDINIAISLNAINAMIIAGLTGQPRFLTPALGQITLSY